MKGHWVDIPYRVETNRARCSRQLAMSVGVLWIALFLFAGPACTQATSPINPVPVAGSAQMEIPPPVSIQAYPTEVGAEIHSNFLSAGAVFNTAYIDNLFAGSSGKPVRETTFTIQPTISLDQRTTRRYMSFVVNPGFTFYRPTSSLNEIDETANLTYQYRLTPHSRILLNDRFSNSSTSFTPSILGAGGGVSGAISTVTPGIIVTFTQRLLNEANGEFTLQTSREDLVGAAGSATTLHYPDGAAQSGLFDSHARSGSGFYGHMFGGHYLGATYGYSEILAYPSTGESTTDVRNTSLFYSVRPREDLILSVSGGAQYYQLTQTASSKFTSWEPAVIASMGWQAPRINFAISYSHGVTAGGGLLGAFNSNSANSTIRWQMARTWTFEAGGMYAISKSVTPEMIGAGSAGHSISGDFTLEHPIGPNLGIGFEYTRLHQSYRGIPAIASHPDSNRGMFYVSWHFTRPLGR